MIVRNVECGWEIIYQGAHALLAGILFTHLRPPSNISYWQETQAAIVDHDDHKSSFGKNVYLTELGAPKDFTQVHMTAQERFDEVRRRIESGYRKHRWIGLLAARHAEELYRKEKTSKKLDDLLASEAQKRTTVLHELQITEDALELAYSAMQWCDRTSLILCQKALPAMHRRIEIASLGDGKRYEIWEKDNGEVTVDPWPFNSPIFKVQVEVRTLTQMTFATDRELERCLQKCAVECRSWKFHKCESPKSTHR